MRVLPQREVLIAIGSNHDAEAHVGSALQALSRHWQVLRASAPAWSRDQATPGLGLTRTYLNAAVILRCNWPLWRLHRALQGLERAAGRTPALRMAGLVPLDLDILGRRMEGAVHWKCLPRRQRDLHASYLAPHLRTVLEPAVCERLGLASA